MTTLRTALHVHSTWSDGEFTLPELREVLGAAGIQCVAMSDHADTFDAGKAAAYRAECGSLSDDTFRFIAGLEFSCRDRMHIVGYGATDLVASDDPATVIRHIEASGGVAVLAHPAPRHFDLIDAMTVLPDGLEVWNSKYDGPAAPRPEVFELYRRMRVRRQDCRAFYGWDLHWKRQPRPFVVEVDVEAGSDAAFLAALRHGAFSARFESVRLPADGQVDDATMSRFRSESARSQRKREWIKRLKRWSGPLGRALPAPIKSRLRRFM